MKLATRDGDAGGGGVRRRRGDAGEQRAATDAARAPEPTATAEPRGKPRRPEAQLAKLAPVAPLAERARDAALRRAGPISATLFALGIVWVALFPLVCITTGELKCRGTYFSENALSPGTGDIAFSAATLQAASAAESAVRDSPSANLGKELAVAREMDRAGLEDVHVGEHGRHISGVIRPRSGADRRDAIILVAQARELPGPGSLGGEGCSGLGMVLALAQVLADAEWLSKNVVLLVARDRKAVRAFAADYHGGVATNGTRARVPRGGILVGGLVLDLERAPAGFFAEAIDAHVPGGNGLLPNLDLVNVVVYLLRTHAGNKAVNAMQFTARSAAYWDTAVETIVRSGGARIDELAPGALRADQVNQYASRMGKLARFMQGVAFGPTGWHAELLPYDIHAVTLSISYTNAKSRRWAEPGQACEAVGRTTEHTLRSLSNLEEKFHQSYFLYVLPDAGLFVSIGEYAGSLVLVLAPLLLCFLRSILGPSVPSGAGSGRAEGDPVSAIVGASAVLAVAGCYGGFQLGGGARGLREPHHVGLVGLVSLSLMLVVRRRVQAGCRNELWKPVKGALALVFVVAHAMVGMMNYPLALVSACWSSLFYAFVRPVRGVVSGGILLTWWAAVSPAVAAYALPHLVVDPSAWGMDESGAPASYARMLDTLGVAYAEHGWMHVPLLLLVHGPAHLVAFAILSGLLGRAP